MKWWTKLETENKADPAYQELQMLFEDLNTTKKYKQPKILDVIYFYIKKLMKAKK